MHRWATATNHCGSSALSQIDGLLKLRAEIIKLTTSESEPFFEGQDELTLDDEFLMLVDSDYATTEFYLRNCDGGYTIRIEACRPYPDPENEDEADFINLLKAYELDQSDGRPSWWLKERARLAAKLGEVSAEEVKSREKEEELERRCEEEQRMYRLHVREEAQRLHAENVRDRDLDTKMTA